MKTWLTKLRGVEFKLHRLQETVPLSGTADSPDKIAGFLRANLAGALRYNPDVENFVAVFLSTRRRIIGFDIISNGTLDTLLVHPREVFKAAIVTNASAVVLAHNLCAAAHKLCYVARRFMRSQALAALTPIRCHQGKEGYGTT